MYCWLLDLGGSMQTRHPHGKMGLTFVWWTLSSWWFILGLNWSAVFAVYGLYQLSLWKLNNTIWVSVEYHEKFSPPLLSLTANHSETLTLVTPSELRIQLLSWQQQQPPIDCNQPWFMSTICHCERSSTSISHSSPALSIISHHWALLAMIWLSIMNLQC